MSVLHPALAQALTRFPETSIKEWCTHGETAVHKDAQVEENARLLGPAILRGGTFWAGTFRGGTFRGGTFRGGTFLGGAFRGGTFRGGTFLGGTFRGGTFLGGTFWDGTFWDGTFRGGTFRGGTFRGGTFRGGTFLDGTFRHTPFFIEGVLPWSINASSPTQVAIGCKNHTVSEWLEQGPDTARVFRLSDQQLDNLEKILGTLGASPELFPAPEP